MSRRPTQAAIAASVARPSRTDPASGYGGTESRRPRSVAGPLALPRNDTSMPFGAGSIEARAV